MIRTHSGEKIPRNRIDLHLPATRNALQRLSAIIGASKSTPLGTRPLLREDDSRVRDRNAARIGNLAPIALIYANKKKRLKLASTLNGSARVTLITCSPCSMWIICALPALLPHQESSPHLQGGPASGFQRTLGREQVGRGVKLFDQLRNALTVERSIRWNVAGLLHTSLSTWRFLMRRRLSTLRAGRHEFGVFGTLPCCGNESSCRYTAVHWMRWARPELSEDDIHFIDGEDKQAVFPIRVNRGGPNFTRYKSPCVIQTTFDVQESQADASASRSWSLPPP